MKKTLLILFTGLIFLGCLALLAGFSTKEKDEKIMTNKKILVSYFSATGTTKNVAQKLALVTGADLFEIKPLKPYTSADLDWRDEQSRSSLEMKDNASRPQIASKIEDISKYDIVFVGFPIWWYREPSIIDTFIESYDFSNKTIIPFATSGTSLMGDSAQNIQKLAPNAKVFEGKRFPSNVSEEVLKDWAFEQF